MQATLLWSLWQALLAPFDPAFTRGGFRSFVVWVTGLALNTEEHTTLSLMLSREAITARVNELAARISRDYQGKDLLLVGVLKDAFVFLGAWNSTFVPRWAIYVGITTVVLTAAYLLWTIQRVYLGEIKDEHYKHFPDVGFREVLALAPLGILAIVVGVWPSVITNFLDGSMKTLIQMVNEGAKVAGIGGF